MTFDFTFRAQLVSREQRQLYDYWRSCAAMRAMPARRDLDPVLMRDHLPSICLIDIFHGLRDAVVRLAGTQIKDVYGIELTGKCLGDLEWGDRIDYWQSIYQRVLESKAPLHGAIQGPISEREHIKLFWLRLPLSDNGRRVNKILCYDVAVPNCSAHDTVHDGISLVKVANG